MGKESKALLDWYRKNARELPWRSDPTPYKVWVSEIMLQQTRVEAGKAYFLRFVKDLPDVFALANVTDQKLMKLWEGLGYYNRARNLKKAAGVIVEKYAGFIPNRYEELLELPGIGPYTAGAIASIAFGLAVPAIDGNVQRVFSRLFEHREDISTASAKNWAAETAMKMMPAKEAGDFNQALMELGALVCIPNGEPKCLACPLALFCVAYKKGTTSSLPVKKAKNQRKIEARTILLIECEEKILLQKRKEKGLLAGLWEFPNYLGLRSEAEIKKEVKKLGLTVKTIQPIEGAKHIFSHVEWHMQAYEIQATRNSKAKEAPQLPKEGVAEVSPIYLKDVPEENTMQVLIPRRVLFKEYALPSAFKVFVERLGKGQSEQE
ncbi:MAG: A/G-specific adenine glycosylase [Eubacteriales bacterium]|nr:A/G-specific adenine glycosylase [Eubacteriales bacterium]MDD3350335.1 A/G-specific adenine glycosylase [Eubacteriales bacterium]